jgi:hypothetical protein
MLISLRSEGAHDHVAADECSSIFHCRISPILRVDMLDPQERRVIFFILLTVSCEVNGAPKKPLYGYCQTKACAKAKRAAQSGLDNFCKRCYAEKCPKACRKACEICMSQLQLRKGICKPCWASRGCAISGCDWINKEPDAAQCINCQQDKSSTTAKHVRVAMRCPDHATIEQGMFNLCNKCFQKQAKEADDVAAAA